MNRQLAILHRRVADLYDMPDEESMVVAQTIEQVLAMKGLDETRVQELTNTALKHLESISWGLYLPRH